MKPLKFKIIPAPENLNADVDCFRIVEYSGEEKLDIAVSLNGMPGIVFQHHDGHSTIQNIVTHSGLNSGQAPTLFIYGQNTARSVINLMKRPFTMTQVILRPHALQSLLGMNASTLTNGFVEPSEFSTGSLNELLIEAHSEQKRIALLTDFLIAQQAREKTRDSIVEASLALIHKNISTITIKILLECLNISERQFERRFSQTVGISPQFYIRVKRFNEAIKLMKSGQYNRLTDVANALSFYDQSHFIRDIKEFSGITPKGLFQKDDFHHDPGGYVSLGT